MFVARRTKRTKPFYEEFNMNSFLWALTASGIWGIVPILEKLGLVKATPMPGLFYRCLGVCLGIPLLFMFFIKPSSVKTVDTGSALLLISSGFLASFVAQIAFYKSLSTGDVSKVVPVSGSYPLIAFLLGIFLLGENVTPQKLIGCLCIVC
jgi:bacterial/archaeal transporter family protein